jgi:sugar lactone lactonase YvrE
MKSVTHSRPCRCFPALITLILIALASFTDRALPSRIPARSPTSKLHPGDIVYADSGNALEGGFIIKVDPVSGEQMVISSGGYLRQPFAPAVDQNGAIIVSDTSGRLVRVDPETGQQTLLKDNSGRELGMPCGIALEKRGTILVANFEAVVRVEPASGHTQLVSAGGYLLAPIGIAVTPAGDVFVLNTGPAKQIVRINPQNGAQKIVSPGVCLNNPQAIAVRGNDLYVTDVATSDGNFGIGRLLHVDLRTGLPTVIAQGGYLIGPVGVSIESDGHLIVTDPYTINPASPDLYDGGVIRIDPSTGAQTLLARGEGSYVNPRGNTILPEVLANR